MKYRKLNLPVRRNVTLDGFLADHLGAAASFTGYSQSEILEMALNQPIMRRFYAFTDPVSNPIVELLEVYQVSESHMTPRAGESILLTVRTWVEECAVQKAGRLLKDQLPQVNQYIHGHMTDGSMQADPYFQTVYEQADKERFLTPEMSEQDMKHAIITYINAIIHGPNDKNRMGESYLFRNLLVMLDACFERPTDEEAEKMFRELSDGYALPLIRS